MNAVFLTSHTEVDKMFVLLKSGTNQNIYNYIYLLAKKKTRLYFMYLKFHVLTRQSRLINIDSLYLLSQLLSTITEKKNFQDIIIYINFCLFRLQCVDEIYCY